MIMLFFPGGAVAVFSIGVVDGKALYLEE